MSRPLVSVFDASADAAVTAQVTLPAVMTAPIRPDVVGFVHNLMSKNSRQSYAVTRRAGMQTPAESWGTGRAVARIPRVPGGGTSRSGQGAYGNMCRGGRMFAPTKVWRRWHRKISVNQRRYAVASALAASALPPLVMARGHRVENVPEFPLVLDDKVNSVSRTKDAVSALQAVGAFEDVLKSKNSRSLRAGSGKMRNRRFVQRLGPLVIHDDSENMPRAFRNLPGVKAVSVNRLNLLDLAPGGHLGRFCVWTKGAFEKLDSLFGTYDEAGAKKGFNLPRGAMSNADLSRLINSDEIQSVVRPAVKSVSVIPRKANPLKNKAAMDKLNPYAATQRARAAKKMVDSKANRAERVKANRAERAKFAQRKKDFVRQAAQEGEITF